MTPSLLRICLLVLLATACMALVTHPVFAHGGGLDSNGGHHNRKTGGYHTHRPSYHRPLVRRPSTSSLGRGYRSPSPKSYRTKPRKTARRSVRKARSISVNEIHYYEISTKKQSVSNDDFQICEVSTNAKAKHNHHEFIVYRLGDTRSVLQSDLPTPDELVKLMCNASVEKSLNRFFLNGMTRKGISWAHTEKLTDGSVAFWVRQPHSDEFESKFCIKLKHPFREWTEADGMREITARYFGRIGNRVILIRKNGRRVELRKEQLSKEDWAYVEELSA